MQQIQRQLSSDMAWIVTGIFLICIIESEEIMSPSPVTVFSIIYECVSAFANVGASLGYPNTSTSQSAQYRTLSKLVVIVLMYRGRHRGKYSYERNNDDKCNMLMHFGWLQVYLLQLIELYCYRLSNGKSVSTRIWEWSEGRLDHRFQFQLVDRLLLYSIDPEQCSSQLLLTCTVHDVCFLFIFYCNDPSLPCISFPPVHTHTSLFLRICSLNVSQKARYYQQHRRNSIALKQQKLSVCL